MVFSRIFPLLFLILGYFVYKKAERVADNWKKTSENGDGWESNLEGNGKEGRFLSFLKKQQPLVVQLEKPKVEVDKLGEQTG